MNKKIIFRVISSIVIILVISMFFIKTSTSVYIGNYSYIESPRIDIRLKIDNELILSDSLYNNPFSYTHITKNLRYGIHTINLSSKKAELKMEKKIFLFPNQHIYIEFLPADSLLSIPKDTLFFADGSFHVFSSDSLLNHNLNNKESVYNKKSIFIIESLFNPFYIE